MPIKLTNNIFQIVVTTFLKEISDDTLVVALDNLVEIYNKFEKDQALQEYKGTAGTSVITIRGCNI